MNFKQYLISLGCTGNSPFFGDLFFLVDEKGKIYLDIAIDYNHHINKEKNKFLFGSYKMFVSEDDLNPALSDMVITKIVNLSKSNNPFIIYDILKQGFIGSSKVHPLYPENSTFSYFIDIMSSLDYTDAIIDEIYIPTEDNFLYCITEKIIKSRIYNTLKNDAKNTQLLRHTIPATPTKLAKKYIKNISDADIHLFASIPIKIFSDIEIKTFSGVDDFQKYYHETSYADHTGVLGSSCMKNSRNSNAIKFYGLLSNCNIVTLYNTSSDKIHGRSILWNSYIYDCGNKTLREAKILDRFYTIENVVKHTALFIKYADANNYYYMTNQTYGCGNLTCCDKTYSVASTTNFQSVFNGTKSIVFSIHDIENPKEIIEQSQPYFDNFSTILLLQKSKKVIMFMTSDASTDSNFARSFYNTILKDILKLSHPIEDESPYFISRRSPDMLNFKNRKLL